MMGTDYGHADTSSEIEALQRLKDQPGVSEAIANKILGDNPRRLYAL
jgi:predicted TIM-barrel fold metal-dependent hydrolase